LGTNELIKTNIDPNLMHIWNKGTQSYDVIDLSTGKSVQMGVITRLTNHTQFDAMTADMIVEKIAEGMSLKELTLLPEFPSRATINFWRRSVPEFESRLEDARRYRAEYYHDHALTLADEICDRDSATVNKVKIDTYKWAAEKNDPARYGKKEDSSSNTGNITVIIDTGISKVEVPNIIIDPNGDFRGFEGVIDGECTTTGRSDGVSPSDRSGEGKDTIEEGRFVEVRGGE
jgi:hypothetical protein